MGKLRTITIIHLFIACFANLACAHSQIWTGQGELSNYESLSESLKTHSVIILGESHGLKTHQNQHLQVLKTLRDQGRAVHVGMEFFYYPDQSSVDAYRIGELSEEAFLKKIVWGSMPFEFYKHQALFPKYELGERTWALNAPRALTSRIAKVGIENLTPELVQLMPPGFAMGRDSYRARFAKVMGDHLSDPALFQKYFEAQSTWDDTMAWRIETFKKQHPEAVMVVIVGEFHVQYGGGLPDRLKQRGIQDVLTISQVNTHDMPADEIRKQIEPDSEYGPRADWIWTAPAVD